MRRPAVVRPIDPARDVAEARVLPHDLDAECSVLGAILLDPSTLDRLGDLRAEDFYRENNGHVYSAARAMAARGEPIDNTTLAAELATRGVLERVGGRAHLAYLQEVTPTAANAEHYARIVSALARKRAAIAEGNALVAAMYDPASADAETLDALLLRHADSLAALRRVRPLEVVSLARPVEASEFPVYALPAAAANFVGRLQENRLPAEYLGPAALATLATALGGSMRLEFDSGSWAEPLILWYALVGRSGTRKSPAIRTMCRPLLDIEKGWAEAYDREYEGWEADQSKDRGKEPTMRRLRVDDTTLEALGMRLKDNPAGLVQVVDELASAIHGLGQYKRNGKGDRAKFLSLWNGDPLHVDRVSRTLVVPAPVLNVLGGVQPAMLECLDGADGLRNRFLVSQFVDDGSDDDGEVQDTGEAASEWAALVRELARYRDRAKTFRLSAAAQRFFRAAKRRYRAVERSAEEPEHLREWSAKAPAHLARHALLLAAIDDSLDGKGFEVNADHMEMAGALTDYFLGQMRGLMVLGKNLMATPAERDQDEGVAALVAYLLGRPDRRASSRDVKHAHVGSIRTADDLTKLLRRYEATYPGHVRQETGRGGPRQVAYAPGHVPTDAPKGA